MNPSHKCIAVALFTMLLYKHIMSGVSEPQDQDLV